MKVAKTGLILVLLLQLCCPGWCALFGDYDGSGAVNLDDVVYLWAQVQLEAFSGTTPTVDQLKTRAGAMRSSVAKTITALPAMTAVDLNGDSKLDLNDVVLLWGWYQLESFVLGSGNDASKVEARATALRSSFQGRLNVFPGMDIGGSNVPFYINNIVSDQ